MDLQLPQHQRETAYLLPHVDKTEVEGREYLGMAGQGLGEGVPPADILNDPVKHPAEGTRGLGLEHLQGGDLAYARAEEVGQAPGEVDNLPPPHPKEGGGQGLQTQALPLFLKAEDGEARLPQCLLRLLFRLRLQLPRPHLPLGSGCQILISHSQGKCRECPGYPMRKTLRRTSLGVVTPSLALSIPSRRRVTMPSFTA